MVLTMGADDAGMVKPVGVKGRSRCPRWRGSEPAGMEAATDTGRESMGMEVTADDAIAGKEPAEVEVEGAPMIAGGWELTMDPLPMAS